VDEVDPGKAADPAEDIVGLVGHDQVSLG